MRLVVFLLKSLYEETFPPDIIRWTDKDERIIRIFKKHGNGTQCLWTRKQDSALFLAWEKEKGRHVDFELLSSEEKAKYLGKIKGNFNNALIKYDGRYLKPLKRTKGYWEYQVLSEGLSLYENHCAQHRSLNDVPPSPQSPNSTTAVTNASEATASYTIVIPHRSVPTFFTIQALPETGGLLLTEHYVQEEEEESPEQVQRNEIESRCMSSIELEETDLSEGSTRLGDDCKAAEFSDRSLGQNRSLPVLDVSEEDFGNVGLPELNLSEMDFEATLENGNSNSFEDVEFAKAVLKKL